MNLFKLHNITQGKLRLTHL